MKLSDMLDQPTDQEQTTSTIKEAKASYELDPEKRYEKILAILKSTNPLMYDKIRNMD